MIAIPDFAKRVKHDEKTHAPIFPNDFTEKEKKAYLAWYEAVQKNLLNVPVIHEFTLFNEDEFFKDLYSVEND